MRMTPIVGTKAWFGPRRYGWGWSPVSWEGWLAGAAAVVVALVVSFTTDRWWLVYGAVAAILLLCWLKGTSAGGPRAWQEWDRHRRERR